MEVDSPYLMKLTWKLNEIILSLLNIAWHSEYLIDLHCSFYFEDWVLQLAFCIHGFHICGFNQSHVENQCPWIQSINPTGTFVWGTWASVDIGICWGSWTQSPRFWGPSSIVFHLILLRRTSLSLTSFK